MAKNLNSPLQRALTKIAANKQHKRGPGTLRKQSDTTGPSFSPDPVSKSAQSGRARSGISSSGTAENVKTISRDNLSPTQRDNYGYT